MQFKLLKRGLCRDYIGEYSRTGIQEVYTKVHIGLRVSCGILRQDCSSRESHGNMADEMETRIIKGVTTTNFMLLNSLYNGLPQIDL